MSQFPEQIYRSSTASVVRAWRERFGRYRLVGSRCADCGAVYFPRRTVCPVCNTRSLQPFEHPRTGVITCFVVDSDPWSAVMGKGELVPHIPAVIKLDNDVHVLAEVVDADPEAVEIGSRVRMVVRKLKRENNSNWQYGYKFVLDGE